MFAKGQAYRVKPGTMHTLVQEFEVTRLGISGNRVQIKILKCDRMPEAVGSTTLWNDCASVNCEPIPTVSPDGLATYKLPFSL